jgi:hypothetical protein
MATRSWLKSLALAALLIPFSAGTAASAQSAPGSLSGRLTDQYSRPLDRVTVTLRNLTTGAESRTTTAHNGDYRFTGLGPGEYSLAAETQTLDRGQLDGIEVVSGHESRVQAAIDLAPQQPAPRLTASSTVAAPAVTDKLPAATTIFIAASATPPSVATTRFISEPVNTSPVIAASVIPAPTPTVPAPVAIATLIAAPAPLASVITTSILPAPTIPPVIATTRIIAAPASLEPVAPVPASLQLAAVSPLPAPNPASLRSAIPAAAPASFAIHSAPVSADLRVAALTRIAVLAARATLQAAAFDALIKIAHASADQIQTVSTTISASEVQSLPLPGRDWQSFLAGTSTASAPDDSNDQPTHSRPSQTAVTIDGVALRFAFGVSSQSHARAASLLGPASSDTAIREVEGAAAIGESSTIHAGIQSRRGTNDFHGQTFLFSRQNLWGAQNPFTQWVQQSAAATFSAVPAFTAQPYTPGDQEATFGFGAGGRIRHSHVFWFAALDANQRNDPAVSTVKHPDNFFAQPANDQMTVLSARLGLGGADPAASALASYSGVLQSLDGLLGPAARTSSQLSGFARVDWSSGERHSFTLEGSAANSAAPGGGLSRVSETYGTHSYGSSDANQQFLTARWQAFVTPNLLAVTQGTFGRQVLTTPPETPSSYEQALNVSAWGRLPQITVDSRYGFTIGNPSRFGPGDNPDENLYAAQEQLAWVHGPWLVKAGFDLSHNTDATSFLRNQTGTYSYSSVENFASDALAFAAFGINGQLNPDDQHNCDATGKVWRDTTGTLHGLGYLPCYSYYSQTMGPTNWWLRTNDWASYSTAQWQPNKQLVVSFALRWQREEAPPPLAKLNNPELPLTEHLPSLGNEWGPRAGLAWGTGAHHAPVLRLGYGMYFGRTANRTIEIALTNTGSLNGDLNFFLRPTDNLTAGGAPPFPYVLQGEPANLIKPGAVEFAPAFHNPEIHQAVASVEQDLPGHMHLDAGVVASLGRRLPITLDANIDPAVNPQTVTYAVIDGNGSGPIKTTQIKVPFYASWPSPTGLTGRLNPDYQQISEVFSSANSTYEAAIVRLTRNARAGLSFHARYTYAHAMDWNPNESSNISGPSVLDPADLRQEYGTSDLDVRHSASLAVIWEPRWKLRNLAGRMANGWMLSSIGNFSSGLPYTMRTSGSLAKEFDSTGAAIVALAPGINGYGGDNRIPGVGRNTYRYPSTWKADLRLAKHFNLGEMRELELLAESFNLFNHQNVTELETVGYSIESGNIDGSFPSLNFLTGLKTGQTEFGQPLNVNATDFYRPRQIQFGVRMRF